ACFNYPAPRSVLRRCICSREAGLWRTSVTPSTGFSTIPDLPDALEALPLLAFPPLRAPTSGARKSEILASPKATCKCYLNDVYQGVFSIGGESLTAGGLRSGAN